MPRICPYGSHIYVFAGQSLSTWDLYRSYMGKKAYMGPMQDPNGINAQILPIWVPYIHVCWVIVKPKLQHKKINLSSVSGDALKIDVCINLTFIIGSTEMQHLFYILRDMNRNLILGTDKLRQHGVRIYYNLGCLRIAN